MDDRGYGKTTLLQENEHPVQTPARSDDLAETHPTEGMTKVIPALSCKHDNEERRSGSDDCLARRQLLRQRGGFKRSAHSAGPIQRLSIFVFWSMPCNSATGLEEMED